MMYRYVFFPLLFVFSSIFNAWSQSDFNFYNGFDISNSIVPKDEILRGGPPKDGIPAILNPKFQTSDEAKWLKEDDLVAGLSINGKGRAYPLKILVWHELVNDTIDNRAVLITYCPLCGSIIVFSRRIGDKELTFGVSGLLYQSDVLFYDHQTESLWSQLLMKSISGKYVNREIEILPYTFSTWKEWRDKYPDTMVLSRDTGHIRNYSADPYVSYYNSDSLMFPVKIKSDKLHPKEKILVVISDDGSKAYPLKSLKGKEELRDKIDGEAIVIRIINDELFEVYDDKGSMKESFISYWFAWYAFKPDTELYGD